MPRRGGESGMGWHHGGWKWSGLGTSAMVTWSCVTRHCTDSHRKRTSSSSRVHEKRASLGIKQFYLSTCLHVPYPQRVQTIPITALPQPYPITSCRVRFEETVAPRGESSANYQTAQSSKPEWQQLYPQNVQNLNDSSSTRRRARVGRAKIDNTTAGCSVCDNSTSTASVGTARKTCINATNRSDPQNTRV